MLLRQDCGESLYAGGIGPFTLEMNWGHMFSIGQQQADMMMMIMMLFQLHLLPGTRCGGPLDGS